MNIDRPCAGQRAAGGRELNRHWRSSRRWGRGEADPAIAAVAARTTAAATGIGADPDMLNGGFVNISEAIRRADIVINERVRDTKDLGIVIVGEILWRHADDRRDHAAGHVRDSPGTGERSARVGFALVTGGRIRAIGANPEASIGDARDIVTVGPDPEIRVSRRDGLIAVLDAEVGAAGIPGMPLGRE